MKRLLIRLLCATALLSPLATATPAVENVLIGNVSPTSGCVAWTTSEEASPALEIFSDPAATTEVTHQVRIEYQSLETARRDVLSTQESRAANRTVQDQMRLKRTNLVRISGLSPNTTYHLRPLALGPNGAVLSSGTLAPLTTAATATFIPESRQLVADLSALVPTAGDLTGALLIATHANSRYPLISVIGDGPDPASARFDLSNLLDPNGTTQLVPPAGNVELGLSWLGLPPVGGVFQPSHVTYTGTTNAAALSTTTFTGQGVVIHAEPLASHAVAGLPFAVNLHVTDLANILQTSFNRPLIIESAALHINPQSTPPLTNGALNHFPLVFTTPGIHLVTIRDSASPASTTLEVNTLQMNYQNWRNHHFGSDLADGNPGDNPDHDPFPNFIEYIHGANPASADGSVLSNQPQPGSALTIRFNVNPLQNEFRIAVLVSPDLSSWTRSNKPPTVIQSLPGIEVNEISWTAAELAAETGVASATYYARLAWEPATSFGSWILANNLTGPAALPDANPDNDKDPNFVEFALDSNPNSPASSGKVRQSFDVFEASTAQILTLPVRLGATPAATDPPGGEIILEADGLRYRIQGTTNLIDWNLTMEEIPARTENLPPLNPGYEYRSFRSPGTSTHTFEFVRVRIELANP